MFLTVEQLRKYSASEDWIQWFSEHYPDRTQLTAIIEDKLAPLDFLYWLKTYMYFDEVEQEVYNNTLQIVNSSYVYHSNHIFDSYVVSNSYDVHGGQWIYSSDHIEKSKQVWDGRRIKNSSCIGDSQSVNDSYDIIDSKSIKNSHNVSLSTYVINSHDVYGSNLVTDSTFVLDSTNITDGHFCSRSKNLTHSLFCWKKDDGKYLVFNEPVTEAQWQFIYEELQEFTTNLRLNLFERWEKEDPLPQMTRYLNYNTIMSDIVQDKDFIEWVGRLPHYDPLIFYGVTFDSNTNFEGKQWTKS